jgi:hypothetical protein
MKLPIEIDRRQRVVASLMIMGFDLPQPMREAGQQMLAATKVCPGLKADEIPMQGARNRRLALKRARDLIDEMLAEAEAAAIATPEST